MVSPADVSWPCGPGAVADLWGPEALQPAAGRGWHHQAGRLWAVAPPAPRQRRARVEAPAGALRALGPRVVEAPAGLLSALGPRVEPRCCTLPPQSLWHAPVHPEVPTCDTRQNTDVSDRNCAHARDEMLLPLQQATAGSPHYMAPELFHPGAVYSFASDLWALGVVLHECFAGAQPFRRELFADLQRDIEGAAAPPLKGGTQPALDRAPAWAALASLLPSLGLRLEAVCESDQHDLWSLLK